MSAHPPRKRDEFQALNIIYKNILTDSGFDIIIIVEEDTILQSGS